MTEDEKNGITDTSLNQFNVSTRTSSTNNTNHPPFASSTRDLMEMLHDETMRQLEFAWEAERKLVALCMPKDKPNPISVGSDFSSSKALGNLNDDDDANANKSMSNT